MGRDRYHKQSLGALYGRIKQVCLLHLSQSISANYPTLVPVKGVDGRRWGHWM